MALALEPSGRKKLRKWPQKKINKIRGKKIRKGTIRMQKRRASLCSSSRKICVHLENGKNFKIFKKEHPMNFQIWLKDLHIEYWKCQLVNPAAYDKP